MILNGGFSSAFLNYNVIDGYFYKPYSVAWLVSFMSMPLDSLGKSQK